MKTLFGTLLLCIGCHLTAAGSRQMIVQVAGEITVVTFLDAVVGGLPFLSIPLLLAVGIVSVLRHSLGQVRAVAFQLPLILIVPLIPFAVYASMVDLTYTTGSRTDATVLQSLARSNGLVLTLGCITTAIGLYLLLQARNTKRRG